METPQSLHQPRVENKENYSRPKGSLPPSLPIAGSLAPLSGQGLWYRQATAADGSSVHRGADLRNTEMRCTALLWAILLLEGDCNFGFDHHRCVATDDSAAGGCLMEMS